MLIIDFYDLDHVYDLLDMRHTAWLDRSVDSLFHTTCKWTWAAILHSCTPQTGLQRLSKY
jgi:hypothetical protein